MLWSVDTFILMEGSKGIFSVHFLSILYGTYLILTRTILHSFVLTHIIDAVDMSIGPMASDDNNMFLIKY